MSSIAEEQTEVFRKQWGLYPGQPKGLHWRDAATQELRFEKLFEYLKPGARPISVLDVGCGGADLKGYLDKRSVDFLYTGVDLVEEMLEYARKRYPDAALVNSDFVEVFDPSGTSFDWVVSSGVFNYQGGATSSEWREFFFASLSKMYELANEAIAFNFLIDSTSYRSPNLAYFSVGEVVNFCRDNFSRHLSVAHDYPLYECTVTVYRSNYVRQRYSGVEFQRYWVDESVSR